MEKVRGDIASQFTTVVGGFLRKCIFSVLSMGPLPNHIAFIMDGNRRYAKKRNIEEGAGHRAGYLSLMSVLYHCYELGVKYVTVYAFSIENFKRRPEEVQHLMDLMLEKIEELLKEESIVKQYGIRIYFIGNLKLLNEPVRAAAEKAMVSTANNTKSALLICVAYTSYDEIVHAVEESCKIKRNEIEGLNESKLSNYVIEGVEQRHGLVVSKTCNGVVEGVEVSETEKKQGEIPSIKLVDIEKHMYMAVAPDPDILIRSSGESRLSNFLLWQTTNCPLYSPTALWPEVGLWHLLWAVLNFQQSHYYLEKKKKQP